MDPPLEMQVGTFRSFLLKGEVFAFVLQPLGQPVNLILVERVVVRSLVDTFDREVHRADGIGLSGCTRFGSTFRLGLGASGTARGTLPLRAICSNSRHLAKTRTTPFADSNAESFKKSRKRCNNYEHIASLHILCYDACLIGILFLRLSTFQFLIV